MTMPSSDRAAFRTFTLGALALLALTAAPAAANMAAPPPPAKLSSLTAAGGPSPIEVRDGALVIDCGRGPDACSLRVTYQLHNDGSARVEGVAAFYAIDTDDVAVTVDGQPADTAIGDGDAAAFDASIVASDEGAREDLARYGVRISRHGVAVALAAGAAAEVVVTGTIHPTERHRYYLGMPAAPARHRLFVRGGRTDRRIGLRYFVAPIRTWSGFPAAMSFTLVHPAGWEAWNDGVDGATTRTAGGLTTHEGRLDTAQATLAIDLTLSARTPIHAGALLGIGGHVDDATGVRLRAGVEAGRGAYLASLALEVERDDDATGLVVVPAITAASPWVIIVPSIGLGAGVPIRIAPTVEIGGRVQADAQLGPLGMLLAIDYFPGMEAGVRRFTVAVLGQLSL